MKKAVILALALALTMSGCTVMINSDNNTVERTTDVYDPVVDVLGAETE